MEIQNSKYFEKKSKERVKNNVLTQTVFAVSNKLRNKSGNNHFNGTLDLTHTHVFLSNIFRRDKRGSPRQLTRYN